MNRVCLRLRRCPILFQRHRLSIPYGMDGMFSAFAVLTFFSFLFFPLLVILTAHKFSYRGLSGMRFCRSLHWRCSRSSRLSGLVFLHGDSDRGRKYHERFFKAIRWNWPGGTRLALLGLGVVLLIGLQVIAHFLPIPKSVPMDQFFKRRWTLISPRFLPSVWGRSWKNYFFADFFIPCWPEDSELQLRFC